MDYKEMYALHEQHMKMYADMLLKFSQPPSIQLTLDKTGNFLVDRLQEMIAANVSLRDLYAKALIENDELKKENKKLREESCKT